MSTYEERVVELEAALRSIAADGCQRGLGDGGCNAVAPFDGWKPCPACRATSALAAPDAGAESGGQRESE